MPELPEVETVCRLMRRVLVGHKIVDVEIAKDDIVYKRTSPEEVKKALLNKKVEKIGRRGKTWWIELDSPPVVFGHLGMSGWIREMNAPTVRLREHGEAPLDDKNGSPRFMKFILQTDEGRRLTLTDLRRLARVWLSPAVKDDEKLQELGPDALEQLPKGEKFGELFNKRKAPIKALLMDQSIIAGIGNWLADEVLYHSRIAPQRAASSLSHAEFARLRKEMLKILKIAVEAGADSDKYPKDWIFHVRWGGDRGEAKHGRYKIVREPVGGRTTAWVPALQK